MYDGIKTVAEVVKESKLGKLDLSDCMLTSKQIGIFAKMLGKVSIILLVGLFIWYLGLHGIFPIWLFPNYTATASL